MKALMVSEDFCYINGRKKLLGVSLNTNFITSQEVLETIDSLKLGESEGKLDFCPVLTYIFKLLLFSTVEENILSWIIESCFFV